MITAVIERDTEYTLSGSRNPNVGKVERTIWRVQLSNGRRKICHSRREAVAWCDDMGITYTMASV